MQVNFRTVVLVLLVFGVLLAGIIRFGAAERAQQGPSLLPVDQRGDLYVVFNEKIFHLSANGAYKNTYDFQDLGIGELIGGMAFFGNGDVLLRSGDSVPNWFEQVLIQLRIRQPRTAPGAPGDRLARCNLANSECVLLKGFAQTFKRTFRIDIDAADNIFIADTGRETLYWLDSDGYLIAEARSGLRLPNQLRRDGERIVVANTNRMELTFIALSGGSFAPAEQWQHLKVNVPEARQTGESWPMDLLKAGSDWLVLSQGRNMMFGDVLRFSEDGDYQTRFNLPEAVDPVALARLGDDVIVADYAGLRLLRFGAGGEPRGELMVPQINAYAQEVRAARSHYARLQLILWVVFAGALVTGFAVAINSEIKRQRDTEAAQSTAQATAPRVSESERPRPDDPDIHWISLSKAFRRQFRLLLIAATIVPIIGLALMIPFLDLLKKNPESALALAGLYALLIASSVGFVLLLRKIMNSLRVGVIREWVLLRGPTNKIAIGRGRDIGIAPTAIIIGDVSVPTGGRKLATFEPEEWSRWVEPRLTHARRLTAFDMIRWSWEHQRTIHLAAVAALLLLLAAWPWLH